MDRDVRRHGPGRGHHAGEPENQRPGVPAAALAPDLDSLEEARLADKKYGSTKQGIAPFYSDKYAKIGIQVCDLFDEERLKERLTAAVSLKNVLFEHLYHKPALNVDELFQELVTLREEIRPYVGDAGGLCPPGPEGG